MLSKLGYRFNPGELTPFKVDCYSLIESTINDLTEKAEKDAMRKAKSGKR
jgi:hypothetical protein